MPARSMVVIIAALVFASPAMAGSDASQKVTPAKAIAASPAIPLTLAALFETSTEVTVLANGSSVVAARQEVLIAHRTSDGTMAVTCVATPEAAAKLMTKAANAQQQGQPKVEEK